MPTAKETLNKLKWNEPGGLIRASVSYVHRGAPNDEMTISGKDILELGNSFIQTKTAEIPYHRIFKITYEGETVWTRH